MLLNGQFEIFLRVCDASVCFYQQNSDSRYIMNHCCVCKSNQTICPRRLTCSRQNEEDDGQDVEGVMIGDTHLLVLPQGRMET